MKPVRTASSNMVYLGPTPDIGDLHCERLRARLAELLEAAPDAG